MSREDVVVVYCSSCRAKIPAEDLFGGKALSVGQYCFCRNCVNQNQLKDIRRTKKPSVTTRRQELAHGTE